MEQGGIIALHQQFARSAVENGQGSPGVVDDRAVAVLVHDVPWRDERRRDIGHRAEVRSTPVDHNAQHRGSAERPLEPGEVESQRIDHLGRAFHLDREAIHVEMQ